MKRSAQSSRDRILWILANIGGKKERSRLRKRMAMKYADLDPILEELEKEGRIIRLTGKEMIILKDR
jgi:DNA-binding MarR family transcriptional regulator